MVKSELISAVAKRLSVSHAVAKQAVDSIIDIFTKQLTKGPKNRVELRGFGTLSLRLRPRRNSRNPRNGDRLVTPPKYCPYFRAGKLLRQQIDAGKAHYPIKEDTRQRSS